MLRNLNLSSRFTDAEPMKLDSEMSVISKIDQHISWISNVIFRIINFQKSIQNAEPHSSSPSSLLLDLSFVRISAIPQYSQLSLISKIPITLTSLSNGQHYALITSLLTNGIFAFEPKRSTSSQFDIVFKSLASIGFKPRQPCTQFGLMSGLDEHHINLCETLEFAVFERSLSIDKLLEDIRKVPRSFFVITEGYYPTRIEDAIALWLSKFPCIDDLPEISYSDYDKFQDELSDGMYFSAVLSRIYPQRISKSSILIPTISKNDFHSNFNTSNFCEFKNNKSNSNNFEKAKQILDELGAFVPSSFPLSYNLFMCFISDLYYATRIGVKKFVRIERSPSALASSRRPQTEAIVPKSITTSYSTTVAADLIKQPKLVILDQIETEKEKHSKKPIQSRPRTGPNVFRPSRKRTLQNSVSSKPSENQKKKITEIQIHQKRPIKTAIPQKRPSLVPSKNKSNFTAASVVDDEADLLHLFTCIKRGERKEKFVDVENPLIMIKPLCTLLNTEKVGDQNFSNFWSLIEKENQSDIHYKNCFAFLNALGGNNNEFAASRRVVYFARQMLKSYQPDLADQLSFKAERSEVKTAYLKRRASLLKKAKLLTNNLNPNPDFKSSISESQSDSLINAKL